MYALTILGCGAPLVDERVIGMDVAATESLGAPDDRLGASVAWDGARWAAGARGYVRVDGVDEAGPVWAGFWGEVLVTADGTGAWWLDGAPQPPIAGARLWAAGPAGVAVWDGVDLRLPDGTTEPVADVQALAVGAERVHVLSCDPDCVAWTWDGAARVGAVPGGPGGAVAEWNGELWAGDPMDEQTEGAGRVCSASGRCVAGLPGDHLGSSIGGGFAGGTFNRWILPPRARFVPLEGGTVYALEVGAETQRHSLAGEAGTVVLGAPYHPHDGGPAGLVAVFSP